MIDENRLKLVEENVFTLGIPLDRTGNSTVTVEMKDLIRLARLGLWAENHGVPKLKESIALQERQSRQRKSYDVLMEALAALPKE